MSWFSFSREGLGLAFRDRNGKGGRVLRRAAGVSPGMLLALQMPRQDQSVAGLITSK